MCEDFINAICFECNSGWDDYLNLIGLQGPDHPATDTDPRAYQASLAPVCVDCRVCEGLSLEFCKVIAIETDQPI